MTWMGHEQDNPKKISDEQKVAFQRLADHLNDMAGRIGEPMDPKVQAHLRMAADCIEEQIQLDKYYPWGCDHCGEDAQDDSELIVVATEEPNTSGEYRFLDNEEQPEPTTPSAEQLQNWLSNGAPKEGPNDDA